MTITEPLAHRDLIQVVNFDSPTIGIYDTDANFKVICHCTTSNDLSL